MGKRNLSKFNSKEKKLDLFLGLKKAFAASFQSFLTGCFLAQCEKLNQNRCGANAPLPFKKKGLGMSQASRLFPGTQLALGSLSSVAYPPASDSNFKTKRMRSQASASVLEFFAFSQKTTFRALFFLPFLWSQFAPLARVFCFTPDGGRRKAAGGIHSVFCLSCLF